MDEITQSPAALMKAWAPEPYHPHEEEEEPDLAPWLEAAGATREEVELCADPESKILKAKWGAFIFLQKTPMDKLLELIRLFQRRPMELLLFDHFAVEITNEHPTLARCLDLVLYTQTLETLNDELKGFLLPFASSLEVLALLSSLEDSPVSVRTVVFTACKGILLWEMLQHQIHPESSAFEEEDEEIAPSTQLFKVCEGVLGRIEENDPTLADILKERVDLQTKASKALAHLGTLGAAEEQQVEACELRASSVLKLIQGNDWADAKTKALPFCSTKPLSSQMQAVFRLFAGTLTPPGSESPPHNKFHGLVSDQLLKLFDLDSENSVPYQAICTLGPNNPIILLAAVIANAKYRADRCIEASEVKKPEVAENAKMFEITFLSAFERGLHLALYPFNKLGLDSGPIPPITGHLGVLTLRFWLDTGQILTGALKAQFEKAAALFNESQGEPLFDIERGPDIDQMIDRVSFAKYFIRYVILSELADHLTPASSTSVRGVLSSYRAELLQAGYLFSLPLVHAFFANLKLVKSPSGGEVTNVYLPSDNSPGTEHAVPYEQKDVKGVLRLLDGNLTVRDRVLVPALGAGIASDTIASQKEQMKSNMATLLEPASEEEQ